VVSLLVIAGFFTMLWILLHPPAQPTTVTATDVAAKTTAAADAVNAADAAKQAADKKLADAKAVSPQVPATVDAAQKDADTKGAAAKDAAAKATAAQPSPNSVLFTLLGALGAAFTQVVNYWLGSSKGSTDKTALMAAAKAVPGAQ
jgi:hypothetical protein